MASEPRSDERVCPNLTIALIVEYVRDRGGDDAVGELLSHAGETRPMAELLDERGWSSHLQKVRLLEAAVAVLDDPEAPRRIGASMLQRQMGAPIRLMLRALGSPASVCRAIPKASAKFSTNYTCDATDVTSEGAVVSTQLHPGYELSTVDCGLGVGLLTQIPCLFGLPPADVVHEQCQALGDPACVTRVRWQSRRRWPWQKRKQRIGYLEEELRLLNQHYSALQSTIVDLVSPADVDTVLDRITARAADAIGCHGFVLAVTDESGGVSHHQVGLSEDEARDLVARVLAPGSTGDRDGSLLVAEVATSRRSYGRLIAVYGSDHQFFDQERDLFTAYARQAAVALEAATALDEARRRGETASTLLDLAGRLADATSTEEVTTRLAEAVPMVVGYDRSSVLLWDPDREVMVPKARSAAGELQLPDDRDYMVHPKDTPVLAEMIRTLEPQHVLWEEADPFLRNMLEQAGAAEMLAVPIRQGEEMIGAIAALRSVSLPRTVDRAAVADRLRGLADQASLAFEKVRLLEQERESVLRLQRNEQRVTHMAYHDALTELPNRRHFAETLQSALGDAGTRGSRLALLFCDLDRFKNVNDSLGHTKGDEILKAAADRLGSCVGDTSVLARFGGDEFTLLVRDIEGEKCVAPVAESVLQTFRSPFSVDGQEVFVSASIGVALYPEDGTDAQTLLKNADTAMYRAKLAGRNNFLRYAPAMNARARHMLELEADLHEAVEGRQLVVHYQPQVESRSGRVVAVEALVRWKHPRLGLVPPGEFISLAEERGMIAELDAYVLGEAAAQCRRWTDAGLPPVRVAANLSAYHFRGDRLVPVVDDILRRSGARPELIELELTETATMQEPEWVAEVIERLRNLGVTISLDDFGTGYSSWTHLKHFPVDRIKVDRSFVSGLPADRHDAAIVSATIDMAHLMDITVTAEGVETEAQAEFLRRRGCDLLQGFLYGAAEPAEQMTARLERQAAAEDDDLDRSVA